MRFEVDAAAADVRLDVALGRRLGESRSRAAARIDRGEVRVDGRPVARSHLLTVGSVVEVATPPPVPTGAGDTPVPPIRYEDEHLLVVAKPAGLTVHPGTGRTAGTLVQALVAAGIPLAPAGGPGRPGVVHRLDRGTSGLLVVAKTDEAYAGLVVALKRRDVTRNYRALVEGDPGSRGRVEAPIGRDPRDRTRFAAVADGKPATTHWIRDGVGAVAAATVSELTCRLETGRTHQIRVHLAYAGCPVAGDPTYGADEGVAAALGLERPFLHAAELAFVHPVTGAAVRCEEPLPDDLSTALARAGLG